MSDNSRSLLGPGFVLGVLVAVPINFFLFARNDELIANETLLGAVMGAVIAGAVSIGAQVLNFTHEKRRREEDDRTQKLAMLRSILLQLMAHLDHVQKHNNYYRTFEARNQLFIDGQPLLMQPLRGNRETISFAKEEKTAVIDMRNAKFFNSLVDLEGASRTLVFLEDQYLERFLQLQEDALTSGEVQVEGKLVTSVAKADPVALLQLTDILDQLRNALRRSLPQARVALNDCADLLRSYGRPITFSIPEDIPGEAGLSSDRFEA